MQVSLQCPLLVRYAGACASGALLTSNEVTFSNRYTVIHTYTFKYIQIYYTCAFRTDTYIHDMYIYIQICKVTALVQGVGHALAR